MINAQDAVARRGGLAATHELYGDGLDQQAIRRAVADGHLLRVRQGWYSAADLPPELVRAARVGGRLGCQSALALLGVWVHLDERLHVTVDPHSCRLRSPDDPKVQPDAPKTSPVTTHWHQVTSGSRLMVDSITAISELCSCSTPELVAASADSLLRVFPAVRDALGVLAVTSPARFRNAIGGADGICESGIETIFWSRMTSLRPRRQVSIPTIGRVDFLIGDRLVVEVDGEAFHTRTPNFESDRRRDAALSALGYRVLRFSYRQVMFDWPSVEAAVRAAIARGDRF